MNVSRTWRNSWRASLLVALLAQTASARAQHSYAACVATLNDQEVVEQLAFLKESLVAQRAGAIAWWTGWTAMNILTVGVSAWQYKATDKRLAADTWLVSIIGAGAFLAQMAVLPMPGMYASRRLSRLPEEAPSDRRQKLRRGLELLDRAAFVESTNSNWTAHLMGFVFATASSGYVWARNTNVEHRRLALAVSLQFLTSIVFAEVAFWTVPRRARRDRQTIDTEVCTAKTEHVASARPLRSVPADVGMSIGVQAGQLVVTGRF